MIDDFIQLAKRQRRELQAALDANPLYRRIQILERTIAELEAVGGNENTTETLVESAPERSARRGSKTAIALAASVDWFAQVKRRAKTPEVLSVLEKQGITFDGKNAVATLASMLSASPLFDHVNGEGYGLVASKSAVSTPITAPRDIPEAPTSLSAIPTAHGPLPNLPITTPRPLWTIPGLDEVQKAEPTNDGL